MHSRQAGRQTDRQAGARDGEGLGRVAPAESAQGCAGVQRGAPHHARERALACQEWSQRGSTEGEGEGPAPGPPAMARAELGSGGRPDEGISTIDSVDTGTRIYRCRHALQQASWRLGL